MKFNLAKKPPSLTYEIRAIEVHGVGAVPRISWLGESQHTAASLNQAQMVAGEEPAARIEAINFLREVLADGAMTVKDVRKQARAAGISDRTLDRAKASLGIRARKSGFGSGGPWEWILAESTPKSTKDSSKCANIGDLASFDNDVASFEGAIEQSQTAPREEANPAPDKGAMGPETPKATSTPAMLQVKAEEVL